MSFNKSCRIGSKRERFKGKIEKIKNKNEVQLPNKILLQQLDSMEMIRERKNKIKITIEITTKMMRILMMIKTKITTSCLIHRARNKLIKRLKLFWVGDHLKNLMIFTSLEHFIGIIQYQVVPIQM